MHGHLSATHWVCYLFESNHLILLTLCRHFVFAAIETRNEEFVDEDSTHVHFFPVCIFPLRGRVDGSQECNCSDDATVVKRVNSKSCVTRDYARRTVVVGLAHWHKVNRVTSRPISGHRLPESKTTKMSGPFGGFFIQ